MMVAVSYTLLLVLLCSPVTNGWTLQRLSRRDAFLSIAATGATLVDGLPLPAIADDIATIDQVQVVATGDAKKLFNEGRALEMQGNMMAAQRLYKKVTAVSPRFVYGWSNLGNTQVALGTLDPADESYTTAIDLCKESLQQEAGIGVRQCSDLYLLYLNRGCLRLNNGQPKEALSDLLQADVLRGRPDAIVLQNLARAKELNGQYSSADRDYTVAISMTANEVNPFWLRSALVKLQIGDVKGGYDLLKRVENRFPEAPEVRAASSVFLTATGDQTAGQQKFLEIPDRQRANYSDKSYMTKTISWPPAALSTLSKVTTAVGDGSAI
jgi:tetratricopeptide (TPR) repeat protein